MYCPYCVTQISALASKCPNCTSQLNTTDGGGIVVFLLIIGYAIAYGVGVI